MKYDFVITTDTGNAFLNFLIYTNSQVSGLLIYAFVLTIIIIIVISIVLKIN